MQVSHETIYKSPYIQARGVLKQELQAHLRTRRLMRRGRTALAKRRSRGQIVDAVTFAERPPEIEDRAIPGHWEADPIVGSKNSYAATLVERQTRYLMLVRVRSKEKPRGCRRLVPARADAAPQLDAIAQRQQLCLAAAMR